MILRPIPIRILLVSFEPFDSADRIFELYLVFGMSVLVTIAFVVGGFGDVDDVAATVVVVVVVVDDDDAINVCGSFSAVSIESKFCAGAPLSRSIFFELDECGDVFSNLLCDCPLLDGGSTNTFVTKCLGGMASSDAVSTFMFDDALATSSVSFRPNVMGLLLCSGRPCTNNIEL